MISPNVRGVTPMNMGKSVPCPYETKEIVHGVLNFVLYIYIYIYYPLYNNQPITRPDSHHVIRQYNLYFLHEKLYWTILGKPSNIGYIGQFWNEAARYHPRRPADRPLANVLRWNKWKYQMSEIQQKTGKYNEWHYICLMSYILWIIYKILCVLPSNIE